MWYLILFLILLFAYFLEAVISLPLLLILVIALGSLDSPKTCAIFAFIAGILIDISSVRPLGLSSLFFLAVSLIIQLYRRRFREESIGFLIFITIFSIHIYKWIFIREKLFYPVEALTGAVLVVVVTGLLYFLKPKQ